MKTGFKTLAIALVATLCVAGVASAQFTPNTPGSFLTLQGQVPSVTDAINHDVQVLAPGNMILSITSGTTPQAPLLLLGSILQPAPAVFPVPWGGSIDVGVFGSPVPLGIEVIGDGLNPTAITDFFFATDDGIPGIGALPEFVLAYSAGSNLAGVAFAFQGIVSDPTNVIFPLNNTEAVDANFEMGTALVALLGDEGTAAVPFSFGNTFEFHGIAYTEAFVQANGHIAFGGITTILNNGFSLDWVGWANAEPNIAVMQADWNNVTATSGGVLATQIGNTLTISYGDPSVGTGVTHFTDVDSNSFSAALTLQDGVDPLQGSFTLSWPTLDPTAAFQLGAGLVGHTPGGVALVGVAHDHDLNNLDGAGDVSGTNEAQFEEHNPAGIAASFNGGPTGLARSYNNITINKTGRSCDFIAISAVLGGDLGYLALGTGTSPDDVSGFVIGTYGDAGGETDVIGGSFAGFDIGTGTVTFDPAGLAIPAAVTGIYDDTASFAGSIPNANPDAVRNAQGLEFITLPMAGLAGLVDVEIDFGSGGPIFTLQATINVAGSVTTIYNAATGLVDDGFQNHVLDGPSGNSIDWYGVNFTDLNIGTNGQITFGAGSGSFTGTAADMFAGFGAGPAISGAGAIYGDFSPNIGGDITVTEDTVALNTTVSYNNVPEFGAAAIGIWSMQFQFLGPNSCVMDYTGITAVAAAAATGVSNGDIAVGSSTDLSDLLGTGTDAAITLAGGVYQSSANSPGFVAPDSVAEDAPGGFDFSTIGALGATPGVRSYIDALGTGDWTIF